MANRPTTPHDIRDQLKEAITIIRAAVQEEGYLMKASRTPQWYLDARKFLVWVAKQPL